ncbi:MAG TPA: tripartite tricarboxylate transporter substrate binding protein [Casimicrobiaceae bacterium]|nr:tripartite tricarboxylate transporter substrate binding protein [Casimicrobiaceae bacterium]
MNATSFCAGLAILAMFASVASAQYPSRPIRIIVPIPPGGAPDVAARVIGPKLAEQLGQAVIIDNRTGANGNIAGTAVAKSAPDGYTLLLAPDSLLTINPHIYDKMPFDTLKDLVPVASLVSNEFVLSVNPSVPAKTFAEFIDFARKANPPLPYASAGNGSQHQLAMEMLKKRAGIALTHVPFRGGSPATIATIAGDTKVMFAGSSTAPQIQAGKLRALAVTGAHRSSAFPDLPTIADFYPGYELTIWLGLFAPTGTPEPILNRLRAEVKTVLASLEVRAKLNNAGGMNTFNTTPEEFAALVKRDYDKYGKIVRDVGIKTD